jgi:hypothetical protein
MAAFEMMGKQQAPAARRLAPDPDDIRAARRLHELARRERDMGRIDRAEALAMRALGMLEQYASTSHPEVTAVLGTLMGLRQRREAAGA